MLSDEAMVAIGNGFAPETRADFCGRHAAPQVSAAVAASGACGSTAPRSVAKRAAIVRLINSALAA